MFTQKKRQKRFVALVTMIVFGVVVFAPPPAVLYAQSIDTQTSNEIKDLNAQITDKSKAVDDLRSQADELAQQIEGKQAEEATLQNELGLIQNRIAKIEVDLDLNQAEIDKSELQIKETNLAIESKQHSIDFQKTQLGSMLREINGQDQKGNLEILLTNDSLSKFFSYIKGLEDVQANMQVALTGLKDAQRDLEIQKHEQEIEKANLQDLQLQKEISKDKLEEEKTHQESLIADTQMSESKYQDQLAQIRNQERLANQEIADLQQQIKEKLRQAQIDNPDFKLNPNKLLWPIPNQGITTYFHDPSYPFRSVVGEHSGLDLRTLINGYPSPGLPVHAPASGVVVKIIHNGKFTGNAVYLSHGDLMTVYFHLSEIDVQLDQYVTIGDVIAKTGGVPGLPSSGLVNGPHLHFEVRLNGIPVDPCQYLQPSC